MLIGIILWSILTVATFFLVVLIVLWAIDMLGEIGFLIKKPVEGRLIAIVRGDSCEKIIYSIQGWVMNDEGKMVRGERRKSFWEKKFGSQWIGLPFVMNVYEFPLKGEEYGKQEGQQGQSVISFNKESTDSLFFQHTYALVLKEAESSGNIPLNVKAQITIRRVFPERAFFKLGIPQKALDTVIGLSLNKAREIIQTLNVDEILGLGTKEKSSKNSAVAKEIQERIVKNILSLNKDVDIADDLQMDGIDEDSKSLSALTGYEIITVAIEQVDPALPEKELASLRAGSIAKKAAEGIVATANGEKQAIILRGEGEARREVLMGEARALALKAEAMAMAKTKHGANLRRLQAIQESSLVTPGGDGINLLVQPPTKEKTKE